MKRKALAAILVFVFCAVAMSAVTVQPALAQGAEGQVEADFSGIAGFWQNADSEGETLTITEDGYFIYINGDMYSQGYLVYVDEYEDGNGRYDMYSEDDEWLAGIYQDSEDSIHMGNDDGAVFTKTGEYWEEAQTPGYALVSSVEYTDMVPLYYDSNWNGGYFYSDMTEDGITVIVNCCAVNGEDAYEGAEFRENFAALVSGSEVTDYQDSQNQSLTEEWTYPAYDISFTTGANEDTRLWKMFFFQTDTHTYAYAIQMDADAAENLEEEYWNAVNSLEFVELPYMMTGSTDYDPSANGESLEDFIAFFDNWYLNGDPRGESIRLYGDGTWEYYNAIEEDGTGGYLYDNGTFMTSGTTALQLYSVDGSYEADVSLNEYGELVLTPAIPGDGNFYEDAVFVRRSEIADDPDDDPSVNGESLEDFTAFFDTWYQYGDLNAESIRLYGDGTWEYYNAIEEDGTGGYLYDSGMYVTSGTTVLQLYSSDESHVMDASLNEYGELMLTPVNPDDYGSFYPDVTFIRESESVAYEAQPTGD